MEKQESGVKGVYFRAERGKRLRIPTTLTHQFLDTVKKFAELKFEIQRLEEEAELLRLDIIEIARRHPGLRGVEWPEENIILTVSPRKSWNTEAVKVWLGEYFGFCTEGSLRITIATPLKGKDGKLISSKVIISAIEKALRSLGVTLDGVFLLPPEETVHEVKEDVIKILQKEGKIGPMPSGALKITWAVSLRPWRRG